jgi:hypothetical protein
MKRNLFALAIAASLGLSAHAFGGKGNDNDNRNTNTNVNTPTATAGATAAAAAVSSSHAAAVAAQQQGQIQGQAQGQGQHQSAVSSSGGNVQSNAGNNASQATSVTVEASETWRTAATASAPALATSNGTCIGSSSVGAQGTFGLSFGTTWTDTSCDIRYDAQALAGMGMMAAATARLCQKPEIADAMALAGTPCPTAKAPAKVAGYAGSDPIVLRRLAAK